MAEGCTLPFWLDVLKTLLGVFVGALLAFFVNIRIQRLERKRQEKAAGNLMLAVLSKQFGDFVIAKAGILMDKENSLDKAHHTPRWNQLQPTLFQFSDELKTDMSEMGFLIDAGKHHVLEKLVLANTRYHDLAQLIERHSEAAKERQSRLEQTIRENPNLPFEDAARLLGGELVGRLDSLVGALYLRIERDQQAYVDAGKALRESLIGLFGREGLMGFRPIGANDMALAKVGLSMADFK